MSTGIKQKVFQGYDPALTWESIEQTMGVAFKLSKGRPIEISIEPCKDKRSDAQNRMLWAMFGEVAGEMAKATKGRYQYDKQDAHDLLLQKRYGVVKRMVGNTEVITPHETSKMSAIQASEFIEWSLSWCAEKGWNIMMPADYQEWAKQ